MMVPTEVLAVVHSYTDSSVMPHQQKRAGVELLIHIEYVVRIV